MCWIGYKKRERGRESFVAKEKLGAYAVLYQYAALTSIIIDKLAGIQFRARFKARAGRLARTKARWLILATSPKVGK